MPTIPELSHGFVTGRFLAGVADSAAPGSEPDAMPMEGTVTFTATATKIRVLSETLGPVTVFPRDIQIWLDSEGYLSLNGSRQIALWATDDPDANPTAWQWTATAVLKFQGTSMSDRITFELPTGATVDLTTVAPVETPSPGVVITKGDKGDPGQPGAPGDTVAALARGVLVVSWDDGYASQYSQVAALADELGQRHTFYVNGALLGTSGRMTEAQVLSLHERGHEIGWHGDTHTSFTSLTPATRASEWDASVIEELIGAPVNAFAYPYGHNDATTNIESFLRFTSVAVLTAGFQGSAIYDLHAPMPHVHYRWDWGATADTRATAPDLVRHVANNPVAVHLYAHNPGAAANPTWQEVEAVLRLAHELGVPVLRASDVFSGGPRLVNAGFEDGHRFWLPGPGAGGTGEVVAAEAMLGLNGESVLKCTVPTESAFYYARQYVPVIPGRNYTLRARVKCEGGGSGAVRIGGRSIDAQVSAPTQGALYTDTDWGVASVSWTAGNNVRWAIVDVIAISTAGVVYFDHVDFGETALGNYA